MRPSAREPQSNREPQRASQSPRKEERPLRPEPRESFRAQEMRKRLRGLRGGWVFRAGGGRYVASEYKPYQAQQKPYSNLAVKRNAVEKHRL